MTVLTHAISYAARGWSVIPLRSSGSVDDHKKPLLESWAEYQQRPATTEQVQAWWAKWPKANVGLVMGAVSGLVALDLDGPNAVALLRQADVYLPHTAAVQTKRGYHAIYQHPGYTIPNRAHLLGDGQGSAVDVRGDGGYVVAPPSVHGSGWVYQWVVAPETALAVMPDGLAALLLHGKATVPESATDRDWFDSAWRGVGMGQRNETAARLAGYWLRITQGSEEATYRAMAAWAERCTPVMDLKELRVTIQSVARKERAQQAHTVAKTLPRHAIIEGPEWADELRDHHPRAGQSISLPGFSVLGALVPGDLMVIAGRPAMGKSTFACQLAVEACFTHGLPTWVCSTEMTRAQWGRWMAAIVKGCGTESLPRPLTDEILKPFRKSPIAVTDSGTLTMAELRSLAEGRLGVKLIIVDHLTRVVASKRENRNLEVGEVARGLKSLAKDLQCTVVALCQLNRRVEGADTKQPRLSDLRESGEIEQEADSVMFLWTGATEIYVPNLDMTATIAKNRHGETGQVRMVFDKVHRRFKIKQLAASP